MKRGRRQKSDRISALPEDVIKKILTHMPLRYALKTSILSKKWRYYWTKMPKLVFDDDLVDVSSSVEELNEYKLVKAIFHVLLLRRGPISELCLRILDRKIFNEIHQIILHLSWSKNIKKFTFECAIDSYKLPYSFFSMRGLVYLELTFCEIELPLMFNGFSMLKSLIFKDIMITSNTLCLFLTNCPLLEQFSLIETGERDVTIENECTFVGLFKCLPSIRYLKISKSYMERFASGGIPQSQRLPTSLPHLKSLFLDVCFQKHDEHLSTLCVINSSPNLEIISIEMYGEKTSNDLLNLQDYSGLNLHRLKELKITCFHNYAPEMEFVKLIMANSPVLKKARIELSKYVSRDEEFEMLRDLVQVPLPRASPAVKLNIERYKCKPRKCVG